MPGLDELRLLVQHQIAPPHPSKDIEDGRAKILVDGAGKNSVMAPLYKQTPGTPYVYYQRVTMNDTKSTGLKMSSCFCFCDNTRTDMYTTCDQSIASYKEVKSPLTEIVLELMPAVRELGRQGSGGGLLRMKNRGAIGCWLRVEAKFGFPQFQMRVEDQTIFLAGNDRDSDQKIPICRGRFTEAMVDKDFSILTGDEWERDTAAFYSNVKENHNFRSLDKSQLSKYFDARGEPFKPTKFAKVSWMMSHAFSDLWDIMYHPKTPEMLWEINMLAGQAFEKLVEQDPDPQAVIVNLPKKMAVGITYEVLCFLEEEQNKAVYVLAPSGNMEATEIVLAVVANYKWEAAPKDGQTTRKEDVDLIAAAGRNYLVNFATKGETRSSKNVDLSSLVAP